MLHRVVNGNLTWHKMICWWYVECQTHETANKRRRYRHPSAIIRTRHLLRPDRKNTKKLPKRFLLIMAVRATVIRFPSDPDAQDSSGVPWGVTVTPFASKDENGNSPVYGSGGDLIPRCENCWAYYNTYCDQDQWAWTCSLCGTLNGLSSETISRYSRPESAPENMSSFIDLEMPRNLHILSLYKH